MKMKIFTTAFLLMISFAFVSAASINSNGETPVKISISADNDILSLETTMNEFEVIICDHSGNFIQWDVNHKKIDVSALSPGSYLLHIKNNETGEVEWQEFTKE